MISVGLRPLSLAVRAQRLGAPAGWEPIYVRTADGPGWEPLMVRKPDDSGWESFQAHISTTAVWTDSARWQDSALWSD